MHISYEVFPWTKNHYQDLAPVRKCARPWQMVHETRAEIAVLLVHGFSGYPGELIRPGTDLYEAGFDVYTPRLPGHGTSGRDFLASKAEDWIGTIYDAYGSLAKSYKRVYLVGHSMGGAIATIIADAFDVERLALLAPALLLPSIPVGKLRLVRHFVKRRKVSWESDPTYHFYYEGDGDDDLFLGSEYWSYIYPKAVWELERVRRQAVASLGHLLSDTLVISGGLDKTVPQKASALVTDRGKGKNRHLHIPAASHFMPYDKDLAAQDTAIKSVVEWFEKG
ncbi:alpha/beta fold hydrolase [Sphaerochaeta sp. PS]|uniref:alpha/beta hydrolase n=1 Tax=Sphaerochaeta sp. PS TaxID=3076336 RepID=UPI0028A4BD60|nr:alpha/beta fold hydrolase [Sphaerochaeta sp. PS]MDT4762386.1 alpha/beta fold hydrolase [Sphaerochaeta sp. PS]